MATHRELSKAVAAWMLSQPWCEVVCWELKYAPRALVDVLALSSPRAKELKVAVCEVKKTRSDLLQDLRAKKMLKYQKGATHCYLAATPEALCAEKKDRKAILADLSTRGLPSQWGVLLIRGEEIQVLRNPTRLDTITVTRILTLTRKIAKSFCYRLLSNVFIESEETTTEE